MRIVYTFDYIYSPHSLSIEVDDLIMPIQPAMAASAVTFSNYYVVLSLTTRKVRRLCDGASAVSSSHYVYQTPSPPLHPQRRLASGNGATVSPEVMFLSQSNPIASSCAIRSAVSFLLDLSGVFRATRILRQNS